MTPLLTLRSAIILALRGCVSVLCGLVFLATWGMACFIFYISSALVGSIAVDIVSRHPFIPTFAAGMVAGPWIMRGVRRLRS